MLNRRTALKGLVVGVLSPLGFLKEKRRIYFAGSKWPDKNCFRYAILEKAIYESQNTGTRMLMLSKCEFPGTREELLVELKRLFDGHIHIGKVPIDPLSHCYSPSYAGYTEVRGTKKDDPNEMAWIIAVKLVKSK